jgi:mgtE-like transporter
MAVAGRPERRARAARAVRALSPRRPARRIWTYLLAERRTLRQGSGALVIGALAALVAGITLGSITSTLERLPGLIILIPAVLSMRGTIFGAMGARFGTATHAGLFEVTRERTGVLYQNVFVAIVMTLSSSLYLAVLAKLSAAAFGLASIRLLDLVTISVVGGVVDSAIILCLTVVLAVLSFRRGYDLDAVATPVITAVADMVTVPTLFLATFVVKVELLSTIVAWISIAMCLYATYLGIRTDLRLARRILLEMAAVVALTPLLDILAGTVLEARLDRFASFPGLLVLIPPFVANAGSLGGIYASRLSSKMQLGLVEPRAWPQPLAFLDGSLVVGFGLFISALTGAVGLGFSVASSKAYPGVVDMVLGTVVAGLLATTVAIGFSYYIAVLTSRFGLDPDNHSVPIITSIMDLAGIIIFVAVMIWFGVPLGG